MTIFITQGRYTREALAGMVAKPEDRAVAVTKLAKAAGLKLRAHYLTFGEYDFLAIFEGPDANAMASMAIAASSAGGITDLRTTVGWPSDEAKQIYEGAGEMKKAYRPAGA
jgi:uncharacterized protein with GYD domain